MRKRKRSNSRSKSWEDRESRDMRRDNKRKDDRFDTRSSNNPAWYATDAALLRDAASYPFAQPLGTDVLIDPSGASYAQKIDVIPGVMAFKLLPSVGFNDGPYDPVNVAAKSIYSFIRHANSGHSNYDAPDMMIYLLAMSNVYGAINWAQRLYGMVTLYAQRNRYLPFGLAEAENVDFDNLKDNMANFRMWLNVTINKVASLAVPANMTIFSRIAFLYQNIYSEGLSVKDQLYMYVPYGFYNFSLDSASKGQLTVVPLPTTKMTFASISAYIDAMVDAIWAEEDFGIMSGDILKAYGDNIIKLVSMNEFYPIAPMYDQMVLEQFHNATLATTVDVTSTALTQSTLGEYLISKPSATAYASPSSVTEDSVDNYLKLNRYLSLDAEAPTPEMVIEATRLMISFRNYDAGNNVNYVNTGTEILVSADIYYLINGTANHHSLPAVARSASTFSTLVSGALYQYLDMSAFKFCPIIPIYGRDNVGSAYPRYWRHFGNIDNFTVLNSYDIDKLHTAALLNMLNVPSIARNAINN